MIKKTFTNDNYMMSKWSGGNTRQLAIYPESAKYLDRNFIWRLSSADSDLEESSFTKLPDYDRILMVLEGDVVLAHGDERTVNLKALEQDSFDGAVKTRCFGKLEKDYNLIMRKGCQGRMEVLDAETDAKAVKTGSRKPADSNGTGGQWGSWGFFCLEGYAVVSVNGETSMVREDQQMVITCEPGEKVDISLMGDGKCIFTEVIFVKELAGFEAPAETTGHSEKGDFAIARKLFLTNNKWSKLIRREKKTGEWYSPDLERKLEKVGKFYVTEIVWVIGVLLCLCLLTLEFQHLGVFLVILGFTLLHVFVIGPLIYRALLPKPLCAHVRKQDSLNEYEKKLFEEQASKDIHNEKLMYKYRDYKQEEFNGIGDFIKKLNK